MLCEKPNGQVDIALQAREMFLAAAAAAGKTLAEALMYRSHPLIDAVAGHAVADGADRQAA